MSTHTSTHDTVENLEKLFGKYPVDFTKCLAWERDPGLSCILPGVLGGQIWRFDWDKEFIGHPRRLDFSV
jgi:hypothetical protein